jgi:hypothetical protein
VAEAAAAYSVLNIEDPQGATLLHNAQRQNRIDTVRDSPEQAQDWILDLGANLAALRNQMSQFPITYYFDMGEPESALSGVMLQLSERTAGSDLPALRFSATVLGGAVHSFLELVAAGFYPCLLGTRMQSCARTPANKCQISFC